MTLLRWVLTVWLFLLIMAAAIDADWLQALFWFALYTVIVREPADER